MSKKQSLHISSVTTKKEIELQRIASSLGYNADELIKNRQLGDAESLLPDGKILRVEATRITKERI